jgi:group I intron endonuclease
MKFFYESHANKPGIYKIINTHTNRVYIGQSWTFKDRWRSHKSQFKKNKHQNKFLQNDYNKCLLELGNDDFLEFHVLEVMENSTKEERNHREEFYIASIFDKQKLCYNFHEKSESKERARYSNTPEETSHKKSISMKRIWAQESFKKNRAEFQGQKTKELWKNEEYRNKVILGRIKHWKDNEKGKLQAREAGIKYSARTYELIDPSGNLVKIINLKEFCKNSKTKLISDCLSQVARGSRKIYKGWTAVGSNALEIKNNAFAAMSIQRCKGWNFINENGDKFEVANLPKFCLDNNLLYDSMRKVALGKQPFHRGFKKLSC